MVKNNVHFSYLKKTLGFFILTEINIHWGLMSDITKTVFRFISFTYMYV